ncbi:MAG: hypothetical protein RDV48_20100 [Candidatus Eremiobacteraeota bacterium]|nr:hypothetical protein [Candidatus Eremiobacteraeota bacterium]
MAIALFFLFPFLIVFFVFFLRGDHQAIALNGSFSRTGSAAKVLLNLSAGVIALLWGILSLCYGKGQFFSRVSLVIDRRQMKIFLLRRSPFWESRESFPLGDLLEIYLSSPKGEGREWGITLKLKDLSLDIEGDSHQSMRKAAEDIARFTGLPLVEMTAAGKTVTPPDSLDVPLARKMAAADPGGGGNPPPGLPVRREIQGEEWHYTIIPGGFNQCASLIGKMAITLGVFFLLLTPVVLMHGPVKSVTPFAVLLIIPLIFFIPLIGSALVEAYTGREITVSPRQVVYASFFLGMRREEMKIPLLKVEDVRMAFGTDLLIVSDDLIVRIRNLDGPLTEWLVKSLRHTIRSINK